MNNRSISTKHASASAGRFRALPLFVVLAAVIATLIVLPSSASAAFSISNFTYSNSTLQASGHPTTTISFNRNGSESEDLRDVLLDLPTGVFANPEAATTKCADLNPATTNTTFEQDACPTASHVGNVTVEIKAMSLLNQTVQGDIDILSPRSTEVATLGLTLRPKKICILFVFCAVPEKMYMRTGISIRSYDDSGLRTWTPGSANSSSMEIPLVVVSPSLNADITVNKMTLKFNARANAGQTGPYFWQQTGSCLPATAKVTITSYQNVSSTGASNFTPTGCPSVPFAPTTTVTPGVTTANVPTTLEYGLGIPDADATIQNALPKIVDIDFPTGSGLDLGALSGVTNCTEEQLQARACPASSIIGSANATSKFLPNVTNAANPGLVGNVYAMGVGNQIPVGVELLGPRNSVVIFRGTMGTRGDAQAGTGRVYSTFDRIPQLPFKSFKLKINKLIYKNPATCGTATSTSKVTGYNGTAASSGNGTVVTRTNTYTIPTTGCVAPNTTITAGPPATTPDNTPTFSFTSSITGSSFQCQIDGGAFVACTSPFTLEPLANGSHTFCVRAIKDNNTDASPACNTFTVATTGFTITPTITVSNTQAVAHPNVSASFNISGGQPKQIALKMPNGFAASLSARPLCSNADAAAGNCAAASSIGTTSLTVSTFSGSETGTGAVYLTQGPTGDDAGGVAVEIQFSFGTLITQGGAYLVDNGKNQYLDLRNIPLEVNGTSINATNLSVSLDGSGSFLTNPSSCAASAWISTGTDYAGNLANVFSVPFTATGCATVPFNPTISQSLSSPVAGTETGVTANLGFGVDNSAAKLIRVNEPPTLSPNFPAFGASADQCPASAAPTPTAIFDPTVCPAQASVGTMTIDTPLLPFDLTGTAHLIEKSPIPWIGVKLDSPGIHVRLTGVTSTPQVDANCDPLLDPNGFCQTQISIMFNNVPDVQMTNINMVLDGPARAGVGGPLSGKILKVAGATDPTCSATTPASTRFDPYTGTASVTRSQNITITGCL